MAEYITTDQVKQINTLDPASTLSGNEDMVMASGQLPYRAPLARVAGFCLEGTCSTAAGTAAKVATLTGYIGTVLPNEFAIAFSNADTASGTHTIQVKNAASTPVTLATLTVVDSCGTNIGAGALFCTIIFKVIGNKAFITNHDIREKASNYTIKADGSIVFPEGKKNIVSGQDLNALSDGVWISIKGGDSCIHKPNEAVYNFVLFQWTTTEGNSIQILCSGTGAIFNRRSTGGTWNNKWYKQSFTTST